MKTTDLKLQFLGIIPYLSDDTGTLAPEQIVALSALLTFKGKSVKQLLKETRDKGQDLAKKVNVILNKSSLRGHASIATTPCLAFSFEASKFLDSMLTGITFSSSLMASGRRTDTTVDDIVYPTSIYKNQKAKDIFYKQSTQNIECYRFLVGQNVAKDEASKILQYGIYGTGIMVLPIESLVGFYREYQMEKDWMPEEAKLILDYIESHAKEWGIGRLFPTRCAAPRDIYPYPNIFRDPKNGSLVREIIGGRIPIKSGSFHESRIVSADVISSPALLKLLKSLNLLTAKLAKSKKKILSDWPQALALRRRICRDYNLAVKVDVVSSPSWRVWGEKKRHRTVPQAVESIFYSVDQAVHKIKDQKSNIKNKNQILKLIDSMVSVPPSVQNNLEFAEKYVDCVLGSLKCYTQLIKMKIPPADALFVIPRALRINVLQSYNLFNLISGYYPTRLCSTVEEQLRKMTFSEVSEMKKIFAKKKMPELSAAIQVKCHTTCFCHEESPCGQIKALVKDYDDNFHKEVLMSLEEKSKIHKSF